MSDLKEIIENFDLMSFLEFHKITYSESGNGQVSKNWIGIETCPFCGKENYHCAINKFHKTFSCWICGRKSIFKYINKKLSISNKQIYSILCNYQFPNTHVVSNKESYSPTKSCTMPANIDKRMKYRFRDYLKQRGFPLKIIKKYSLKNTNSRGDFKHRLIFPFFVERELVTFIGRSISVKSYKDCNINKSKVFPKGTLFNFDNLKNRSNVLITEGVFDAIRIGDNCISTSGTNYSNDQIRLLLKKEPDRVFICYDNEVEAQEKAQSLAGKISLFVNHVEVIRLPEEINDVGELTNDQAMYLREKLKLTGKQY